VLFVGVVGAGVVGIFFIVGIVVGACVVVIVHC